MSSISPFAQSPFSVYTSLGPSSSPGGFSGHSFGTPGLPNGFGFPSFGDPMFYFMPAASSFFINRLLGFANNSAVNINVGPTPSTLGLGGLLLGQPFYGNSGAPGGGPWGGGNDFYGGDFFGGSLYG